MEHIVSEITANTNIGKNQFRIDFKVSWEVSPVSGQFVTVRCGDGPLLKRPFSIGGFDQGICSVIYKVVGPATETLSARKAGETLTVLGPLGNGFPQDDSSETAVYVGGGCGMPPLLFDTSLRKAAASKIVFAGFRTGADAVLRNEFRNAGADYRIVTEDGSEGEKGLVTDILKNYLDSSEGNCIIYASGPMPMLEKVAQIVQEKGSRGYLCLESYMGCGFGVCNGCVHPIKESDGSITYKKVCTDGPVFETHNVVWDKTWIAS